MKSTKMINGLVCALLLLAFTACGNVSIEGSWVEPVPGMPEVKQGFMLTRGGNATSINMATLQYEKWEQKDNLLILWGKSIGNHQTLSFSDTLVIDKLTKDTLILNQNSMPQTYTRQE